MRVGVPKEIKAHEFRVGLTPGAVREYVSHGHAVLVECDAGAGIGAGDDDYRRAGAAIVSDPAELFAASDMIVKVKEPQPVEWPMLRDGQILFTYLHLAPDPIQAQALLSSGCIAVAYETVTDANGTLPLLAPMSEVAGRLAVEAAAAAMRATAGGCGALLGGVPGVPPAKVLIIGGGIVGVQAARMAVGLGADVTILERSLARLREVDAQFSGRVRTRYSTAEALEHELAVADAVIGAVLVPGASAPKLIGRGMLARMRPRAVIVDVAIDQGGCAETSRPTTHEEPTFAVDGVIHYCVANMPSAVPLTASHALNNATLPFGLALADGGLAAIMTDPHLRAGLNVHRGCVTHIAVARSLGLPCVAPEEALAG